MANKNLELALDLLRVGDQLWLSNGNVIKIEEIDKEKGTISSTNHNGRKIVHDLNFWITNHVITKDTRNVFSKIYENCSSQYDFNNINNESNCKSATNQHDKDDVPFPNDAYFSSYGNIKSPSHEDSYFGNDIVNYNFKTLFQDLNNRAGFINQRGKLWHITHVKNLVSIIKDGALKSRSSCGYIPYDNMRENEVTQSVMKTNYSPVLKKYVRLFFNPINKAYYNMSNNFGNEMVLIAFNFKLLFAAKNPVLISVGSAHYMKNEDFNWRKFAINRHYNSDFPVKNLTSENLTKIFLPYDSKYSDDIKQAQMSEVLIYDQLSTKFIEKIYFNNEKTLNNFLNEIKALPCYNEISNLCEVNEDMFTGSVNDYRFQ